MENYHKYLNIAELEGSWGFHINTVGSARVAPNKNYPNNRQHPNDHTFTWDKGRILDSYYVVYMGCCGAFHLFETIVLIGMVFAFYPHLIT